MEEGERNDVEEVDEVDGRRRGDGKNKEMI